jgi:ribonuclease G
MIFSTSPHETKVALLESNQVVEVYLEREKEIGLVGSIYKGRVTRVLPGMQSAFVDIGLERDAFLYVSDFFEDLEVLADTERILPEEVPAEAAGLPSEELPAPEPKPGPAPLTAPAAEVPPPDEERQPDFLESQPPLLLPETRPAGRPSFRGHRRRRGGRGRPRHGPGEFEDRSRSAFAGRRRDRAPRGFTHTVRPAPTPPEPHEPILLPGESLAKYRNRVPAPLGGNATTETPTVAPPASEEPRLDATPRPIETSGIPVQETPSPEETELIESPADIVAEEAVETATEENLELEPSALAPTEDAAIAAAVPPEEEPAHAVPPIENGIEASTLLEIEQAQRSEGTVGLPPSVRERTAGGVEWQRFPAGGRRRGGRRRPFRRGRGRGDRRDDRGRRERPARFGGPARPSRGQPLIAQLLHAGQEIIVQIAKEQIGKKGARITSHVTLPGRFLVYMPTIEHIGISRKIGTAEERARLRRLLLDLKGTISGGFVVRTAAAQCSEDDLRRDIDFLVKLWHDIRVRAEESPAPALLHRDLNLIERLLRDHVSADYESVWVDSDEEYAKIVEFMNQLQPSLVSRVKLYSKSTPIFEEMGVQQEIDRALRPKVWLKSGGYIVINHTEALVAIDVNTGKFVGKGSTRLEDTIVKTNLEAVQEIVRQIRLRDLGGIIIIDFIDMEDPRNRHRVMRALEDALRSDRSPSKLLSFNEFGLVAITRKRSRQSLERLICQPCPVCTGTGMVKSLTTLCYEIQTEARKMAGTMDAPELTIRAHPEIVKALKGDNKALVQELVEQTGKNIILQPDNTLHFEQYNIY